MLLLLVILCTPTPTPTPTPAAAGTNPAATATTTTTATTCLAEVSNFAFALLPLLVAVRRKLLPLIDWDLLAMFSFTSWRQSTKSSKLRAFAPFCGL